MLPKLPISAQTYRNVICNVTPMSFQSLRWLWYTHCWNRVTISNDRDFLQNFVIVDEMIEPDPFPTEFRHCYFNSGVDISWGNVCTIQTVSKSFQNHLMAFLRISIPEHLQHRNFNQPTSSNDKHFIDASSLGTLAFKEPIIHRSSTASTCKLIIRSQFTLSSRTPFS